MQDLTIEENKNAQSHETDCKVCTEGFEELNSKYVY